jgi:chaperonin GroEL (HSP60 family)
MQEGQKMDMELDIVEGMKLDRGWISPYFMTDTKNQKCEFEDAYVLVAESKISRCAHLCNLAPSFGVPPNPPAAITWLIET